MEVSRNFSILDGEHPCEPKFSADLPICPPAHLPTCFSPSLHPFVSPSPRPFVSPFHVPHPTTRVTRPMNWM